jgi:hypothetical protein
LLSLLVASPAAAQSADPPLTSVPATAKAAAQESFARGNRLFNQAEQKHDRTLYEAAYLQFSQAFAIYPDDRILWNLIVSEIKTDRDVDGLRHLRAYNRGTPITLSSPACSSRRRRRPATSSSKPRSLHPCGWMGRTSAQLRWPIRSMSNQVRTSWRPWSAAPC